MAAQGTRTQRTDRTQTRTNTQYTLFIDYVPQRGFTSAGPKLLKSKVGPLLGRGVKSAEVPPTPYVSTIVLYTPGCRPHPDPTSLALPPRHRVAHERGYIFVLLLCVRGVSPRLP